jgi:hypothetical protein
MERKVAHLRPKPHPDVNKTPYVIKFGQGTSVVQQLDVRLLQNSSRAQGERRRSGGLGTTGSQYSREDHAVVRRDR